MTSRLVLGALACSRGAMALFKVEGVEAEANYDTSEKKCVWSTQTNSSTTMACLDGSRCDIEADGWQCCNSQNLRYRAKCPQGYTACNHRTPDNRDFMCSKSCVDYGGVLTCEGIHPCAWSSSPMKSCQELVFGYGQYMVSKIGMDGCRTGWKPIQDENTCRDAQTHAGLPFGYVEHDKYSVCNFCAGCSPKVFHLHTNHQETAKWICKRDKTPLTVLDFTLGQIPCMDDNPPSGLGPRDQFGHGCGDYKKAKDWCGNYDDADFKAIEMCCACAGKEADRRRRGSGDGGTGNGDRRRGNVRPGTLVFEEEEDADAEDAAAHDEISSED